jgi:hypothetical protein
MRIDAAAHALERLRRQPVERAAIDDAVAVRLVAEHHVGPDVQVDGLDQLLPHQRHAQVDRLGRAVRRLPVHRDGSLVGQIRARRDLHQRGFAGTISTDEPDDFTGGD